MTASSRGALSKNSPAFKAIAITPSDSTDLGPSGIRAIYVGGAGNLVVKAIQDGAAGTAVTFTAVPVGVIIPICPIRVMAATTATLLIGLI